MIALALLTALVTVGQVVADLQPPPATAPAPAPANPDAVKGTAAEQAAAIYQKVIEFADDEFQTKVKALQDEYLRKVGFPYKTYVTALRSVQTIETRKGNLEAALAVKRLADAVEAAGPPAPPGVEGASRTPKAAQEWVVLFRSADPSIWNTDTDKGRDSFAVPLANAPHGIQYLKLAVANGACVIIPMNNECLGAKETISKGKCGWRGDCSYTCKAHHLGIFDRGLPHPKGSVEFDPGTTSAAGWGFGSHAWLDDKQGFGWAGQELGPTVFEISVKTTALTDAEKANLRE
jgi:hypothetical protein